MGEAAPLELRPVTGTAVVGVTVSTVVCCPGGVVVGEAVVGVVVGVVGVVVGVVGVGVVEVSGVLVGVDEVVVGVVGMTAVG